VTLNKVRFPQLLIPYSMDELNLKTTDEKQVIANFKDGCLTPELLSITDHSTIFLRPNYQASLN